MKRDEEYRLQLVRQWFAKAQDDLGMSRIVLENGYRSGAAFHAQQAAEKFLKALLIWREIEFPRTHQLRELFELLTASDADLVEAIGEARKLSKYAVETRYPVELPDLSEAEARTAIELARQVRESVTKRLP